MYDKSKDTVMGQTQVQGHMNMEQAKHNSYRTYAQVQGHLNI